MNATDGPGDRERPPRGWMALLAWSVPASEREAARGDATEEYARVARERGARAARAWLRQQALGSMGPGVLHRLRRAAAALAGWRPTAEDPTMWLHDLRLAARSFRRRPGFTLTVVVTLALGVGATTALFGVFRAVFLAPVELPDSDELVFVMQRTGSGCCGPASWPDYVDYVERQRSFDGLAAIAPLYVNLSGAGEAERVYAVHVTASAFDFLGTEPLMGRALLPEDEDGGAVVVLPHGLWRRNLGGRPDVLGSTLLVDGVERTVVGVMPEGFDVPSPWGRPLRHQLYLPFPQSFKETTRANHSFPVLARLADQTSLEAAQSDMDRIMRDLEIEYPQSNSERGARVFEVHEYLYGAVGQQLALMLAAAALVLLIACGNVAGLQLARAAGRESELAIRSALGASRGAMVRLLFSESLLLASAGGLLGIGVAHALAGVFRRLLPPTMPRVDEIHLDGWALAFGLGAAALTAIVFGMLPAVLASRSDLASGVRQGGHGTLAPGKERVRDYFIVAQIALGLVLANGSALLVRSYTELRGQEYGFETEQVLTVALSPAGPEYRTRADSHVFFDRVIERVAALGPVEHAGVITRLPLAGGTNGNVLVEGRGPRASNSEGPLVELTGVTGDYFGAMGIPLLMGRGVRAEDTVSANVGVVINRTMAEQVWPGESPLGKRFSYSDEPPDWRTVVGVVGDVRQWGPEQPPVAQAYVPLANGWQTAGYLIVQTAGGPGPLAGEVREAIAAVDPTQPPSDVRTMGERLDSHLAQRRFYTTLIGLFAAAALVLAAAGIYGTVSYFVARRVREFGVRMALGAGGTGITALVLRRGIRLAVQGVGIGLAGVWATTSVLSSLVYGVSATDVPTLVAGCIVLAGVAVAASTIPALGAVRVSPVLALRSE